MTVIVFCALSVTLSNIQARTVEVPLARTAELFVVPTPYSYVNPSRVCTLNDVGPFAWVPVAVISEKSAISV